MLLSVIVYKHKLTDGQWIGAAVVFAGISVEAWVKRKGKLYTFDCKLDLSVVHMKRNADVHAKRVIREEEKATIKDL